MPMQPLAGTLPLAQFLSPPLQPETPRRPTIRSARSRNRASAWAYDIAKWREYQALANPGRRELIDAEYDRLAAAGPDFVRYHTSSSFAEAPLHDINREDKARMLTAFDHVRSGLYHHGRRKQGQAVSRIYKDVLSVLLSFAIRHGRVYPTIATIAKATMCSTRTVLRALSWLELFGFLGRIRRLARSRTALGSTRVVQSSNAYRLTTRLAGLGAMAMNVFSGRNGHQFTASVEKGSPKQEVEREGRSFLDLRPLGRG